MLLRHMVTKKRTDKYWICLKCATKKKGKIPKGACNTVIAGLCGHCTRKDECTLIPMIDFKWPGGKDPWYD